MKKILTLLLAVFLAIPSAARAQSCAEMFADTDWNLLAANVYGDYIFYRTSMHAPNIEYFRAAMRECVNDLNASLQAGELDWQQAALTRFKNLIAIAQVGLYEMNRYVAEYNFTKDALSVADTLRSAYASMREKGLFDVSADEFMRDFRKLEESGQIAATCRSAATVINYQASGSVIQLEYVRDNDNLQHALFSGSAGNQSCEWSGDCVRMAGGRIGCQGSQGAAGTFEAVIRDGNLTVLSQSVDGQCGFAAMAVHYARQEAKP